MTKSEVGILSEWRVACDRGERGGEELLAHRVRTPFAEVDLLMRGPSGAFTVLEVKSVRPEYLRPELVAFRQRARLYRARDYIEARVGCDVRLWLACVNPDALETRPQYFEF